MKLSSINLNLLVALDALLEEENVSKAAKRLNLTQSQLSHILKELRNIFNDELLIRGPDRQMILTEKAKKLIFPVNEAIGKFEDLFYLQDEFSPKTSKYNFTVGCMSEFESIVLVPALLDYIHRESKNLNVDIVSSRDLTNYHQFQEKKLDVALGSYNIESNYLCKEKILTKQHMCVLSNSHMALKNKDYLEVEDFKKYPLLLLFFEKTHREIILRFLDDHLGKGKYKVSIIPHAPSAILLLEKGNHICITNVMSSNELAKRFGLITCNAPVPTRKLDYYMYWKKVDNEKKANIWLRGKIKAIFSKIGNID